MADTLLSEPDVTSIAPLRSSAKHAAVHHILASSYFAKAPLLSAFLLHVSRRSLDDGMVRISEYEIGRSVFQRSADFHPREDNIVRTYARHLRKRLQEYYETDGANDTVRIEIPKGTYVPVFHTGDSQPAAPEEEIFTPPANETSALTKLPEQRLWRGRAWRLPVAVLVIAVYSITLFQIAHGTAHTSAFAERRGLLHPMWGQLFRSDRDTVVVPGDIGFVILQQSNRRTFSLAEYVSWFSSDDLDSHLSMGYLKDQTYTSVLNLEIVSRLQRLPEVNMSRFVIRAARNVRLDDLRNGNAILLGSSYSNPWDEIFSDKLNFHFVNRPSDSRFWIVNQRPVGPEANTYESVTTSTVHKTYAVVAMVPNLNRNGHVLLLQGLDATGTQAAAEMLFNSDDMGNAIQDAINRYGAKGRFELLIEVNSLDANSHATDGRIIASRFQE
ncbi:MAG TPA: hypothetical protein VK638_58450 [Edaphobacter sp.]|nr:hypothetical protein [Edaphobacter sp.]